MLPACQYLSDFDTTRFVSLILNRAQNIKNWSTKNFEFSTFFTNFHFLYSLMKCLMNTWHTLLLTKIEAQPNAVNLWQNKIIYFDWSHKYPVKKAFDANHKIKVYHFSSAKHGVHKNLASFFFLKDFGQTMYRSGSSLSAILWWSRGSSHRLTKK